ncbi:S8 family serine peptidase [Nocardia sp. NPDC004568]|uniref:S8 family serine peptidase n=1 Tax=Nocardia sp. NPDC004568 TaxID=3154551 RepID=UPI0033B7CCB0
MDPLALVSLPRLMSRTRGRRNLRVGLIDGRVNSARSEFADASFEFLRAQDGGPSRVGRGSFHGTAVAGILVAERGSGAPGICPGVTLLVRSVFSDAEPAATTYRELASAIVELVEAGARIVNVSLAVNQRTAEAGRTLREALDHAFRREVIIVAAAGNQRAMAGSPVTRHRSVVPAVAYDLQGRPSAISNLGHSIGWRGIGAPAEGITSLAPGQGLKPFGGTSAAAAVVTGTVALLCSEFPQASTAELMYTLSRVGDRRASVVPPLLNAWTAFEALRTMRRVRGCRDGR